MTQEPLTATRAHAIATEALKTARSTFNADEKHIDHYLKNLIEEVAKKALFSTSLTGLEIRDNLHHILKSRDQSHMIPKIPVHIDSIRRVTGVLGEENGFKTLEEPDITLVPTASLRFFGFTYHRAPKEVPDTRFTLSWEKQRDTP